MTTLLTKWPIMANNKKPDGYTSFIMCYIPTN